MERTIQYRSKFHDMKVDFDEGGSPLGGKSREVQFSPKCGILKQGVPEDPDEFANEILDKMQETPHRFLGGAFDIG